MNVTSNIIPIIGTAVVNNTNWVRRLVSSVDYPVENFVIVNNNGRGHLTEDLRQLSTEGHPFIQKMHIVDMPSNIGVAASWNLFIKWYINSPFWIIVNDDVSFSAGFLEEMYNIAINNPDVGLVHGHSGDFNIGSWDLFLIRDFVIQECGLFDENLYPAYCEDADYIMRLLVKSIKRITNLNSNYYHGYGNKDQYYEEGSQTKKTDPTLIDKLNYSNDINIEYLTEKWGEGWRTCSPSSLPFNNYPISYTTYDLNFVRKKYLGF
jgi:GT2 family glycosyltransferase